MTDIDDRLRVHYRSLKLDDDKVSEILQSTSVKTSVSGATESPRWRGVWLAVAAVVVLSLTLGIHQYGTQTERTTRTLNEAALNHSTRLKLEYVAENIDDINVSMSQLPFEVVLPAQFGEQFDVLGARYCTINGELAAHVKFVDKATAKQVSLFMTQSVEGLQGMDESSSQVDGVNVKLWNESGMFYAMASRSPLL